MYHIFLLKILLPEPFADRYFLVFPISRKRIEFFFQVTAFQVKDATSLDVASDSQFVARQIDDFGQGHNGSSGDEIEFLLHFFGAFVFGHNIFQTDGVFHGIDYGDFLSSAVNQVEFGLRKHDGQRNARETAASAKVHDFHAGQQFHVFCNGKAMQDMVFVEMIHILPGDDIDFAVPV